MKNGLRGTATAIDQARTAVCAEVVRAVPHIEDTRQALPKRSPQPWRKRGHHSSPQASGLSTAHLSYRAAYWLRPSISPSAICRVVALFVRLGKVPIQAQ